MSRFKDDNNRANTNYQYNIPSGVAAVNQLFANPRTSTAIQQALPTTRIPDMRSMFDPANIYAVNGVIARAGLPTGHKR